MYIVLRIFAETPNFVKEAVEARDSNKFRIVQLEFSYMKHRYWNWVWRIFDWMFSFPNVPWSLLRADKEWFCTFMQKYAVHALSNFSPPRPARQVVATPREGNSNPDSAVDLLPFSGNSGTSEKENHGFSFRPHISFPPLCVFFFISLFLVTLPLRRIASRLGEQRRALACAPNSIAPRRFVHPYRRKKPRREFYTKEGWCVMPCVL